MVAGCGNKFVKFVFFTFNLIFCVSLLMYVVELLGAVVCGLAIWLRLDNEFQDIVSKVAADANIDMLNLEHIFSTMPQDTYIVLYIVMGLSGFMFITGFLGCCGAWCESLCVLGVFFSVVLTLFCVQIAGVIYVYFEQDSFHERAAEWYQQIVDLKQDEEKGTEYVALVDEFNKKLNCCDAMGCDRKLNPSPSGSCNCSQDPTKPGCTDRVINKVQQHWKGALIFMGCVLFIEILAMIFACCLCSGVRSTDYDYYYY